MSVLDVFPPELLFKDKIHETIAWLQELPIPARRRKEVMVEWCHAMEVAITSDVMVELLGPLAEEVKG
jgi:hypothetical protein